MIEFPDNLLPEFVKDLKSLVVLDFSASPLDMGDDDLGRLVDYEGDPFTVSFSGNSTQFVIAETKSDGTISFTVDRDAVSSDGDYALELVVTEEVVSTEEGGGSVTSKNSYLVTFRVTGFTD